MDKKKNRQETVWLQLTAGQGPRECAWVVAQLSRIILMAAENKNLSAERVEALAFDKLLRKQNLIEPNDFLSVLIRLEGIGASIFSKQWEGTIQWQGESPYRPKNKRFNWFVGVALVSMPTSNQVDLHTPGKEVDIESMRAKGPGGQHVNKTNSAIRLTHRPTGLQVRVESDRSQHRNKKIALERLQLLLSQKSNNENKSIEQARWLHHYEVKRGSPIRIFCGSEFVESN